MLDVGDGHRLYWELCGNPDGKPVVFLHGGPGGGSSPDHRRQFDPERYNILLFDQRGCGQSTPYASLESNTTWHLVDDIERLRTEVAGVDNWMVFGGSWGSTLALAYAQKHPDRVTELVLRGIFLFDQYELDWLYKEAAQSRSIPTNGTSSSPSIPEGERGDLIAAYRKRLTSDDQDVQLRAAKAWSELGRRNGHPASQARRRSSISPARGRRSPIARIENHYMANKGWLEEGAVAARAPRSCAASPASSSRAATIAARRPQRPGSSSKAWPEVELNIVPDGGHLFNEPGILDGLIRATDRFARG